MNKTSKIYEQERSHTMNQASEQDRMRRDRPYKGQPHTDYGERGKTEIKGLTLRDLRDCYVRACCLSAPGASLSRDEAADGENARLAENDIYSLPWDEMDPVAVAQNLSCEIEKMMGIYPNIEAGKTEIDAILDALPADLAARLRALLVEWAAVPAGGAR